MRRREFWAAVLLVWLLAMAIPRTPTPVGKPSPRWPPRSFVVYYGEWTLERVREAQAYDLVIAQAGPTLTAEMVGRLQRGRDGRSGTDDDVLVVGYLSIGEDSRAPVGPVSVTLNGPGPMAWLPGGPLPSPASEGDPDRAPSPAAEGSGPDKRTLQPSSAGGYPGYFLDERAWKQTRLEELGVDFWDLDAEGRRQETAGHDGLPDRNGVWGSYYVDPGHPLWVAHLEQELDRLAALRLDGVFLDTLDTASPDGHYGYLQERLARTLTRLRRNLPNRYLIGNRGVFLLNTFPADYLDSLDAILLESFFTNWDWERDQAIPSPYLAGDYQILTREVLPAGRPLHLFLDYLKPDQSDRAALVQMRADLLGPDAGPCAWAHPFLQTIYPAQGIPSPGPGPRLREFSVTCPSTGRLQLRLTTESSDSGNAPPALEVRLKRPQDGSREALWPLLSGPLTRTDPDTWETELEVPLLPRTRYQVAVRTLPGEYRRAEFVSPDGPAPVEGLTVEPGHLALQLHWQGDAPATVWLAEGDGPAGVVARDVGPDRDGPQAVWGRPQGGDYRLSGLKAGQAYRVAVCRGLASPTEFISFVAQADPLPVPPTELTAFADGHRLVVRWQCGGPREPHNYLVYCQLVGTPLRLPTPIQGTHQALLGPLPEGDYQVFVTAMDARRRECRPSQTTRVRIGP